MQLANLPHPLQHIALLRLSAIGDAVLMVPTVRALQRTFPAAQITWIIGRGAYSLLEGLSGVNFLVVDKPKSLKAFCQAYRVLSPHRFDVLLAAQASLSANLLCPLIRARCKVGFDRDRARDGQCFFVDEQIGSAPAHLLETFMQFATYLGAAAGPLDWSLPVRTQDHVWAKAALSQARGLFGSNTSARWLAINPAASRAERQWLPERYAALMEQVAARWGAQVVLTGGPGRDEVALGARIAELTKVPCLNLVGKTSLKQLAALLGAVDMVVAPDTGPAHIATAMGTPVVGLYAVASPRLSGPYGAQALTVNAYPQAVETILKESSEMVAWHKRRVHDARAMALITVDEVMAKLAMSGVLR